VSSTPSYGPDRRLYIIWARPSDSPSSHWAQLSHHRTISCHSSARASKSRPLFIMGPPVPIGLNSRPGPPRMAVSLGRISTSGGRLTWAKVTEGARYPCLCMTQAVVGSDWVMSARTSVSSSSSRSKIWAGSSSSR